MMAVSAQGGGYLPAVSAAFQRRGGVGASMNPGTAVQPSAALPGTVTSLGASWANGLTYRIPSPSASFTGAAWIGNASNAVNQTILLAHNANAFGDFGNSSFADLGSLLLSGFKNGAQNYQQALIDHPVNSQPKSGTMVDGSLQGYDRLKDGADHQLTLTIQTRAGATVNISIVGGRSGTSGENLSGTGVDVTTEGTLGDAEAAAIAHLASGFGQAIEGLNIERPKIDLAGLSTFDTGVLSSVDLKFMGRAGALQQPSSSPLDSLSFHADSTRRSLSVTGASGTVNVNVDLTKTAGLNGSAGIAARQSALKNYLDQVDAAAKRAHEAPLLVKEFHDAFTQLQFAAPAPATAAAAPGPIASAGRALTGLSDFKADMSGETFVRNAAGASLVGQFDYELDQDTRVSAQTGSARISQTQHSALSARNASSPNGGTLDVSKDYDLTMLKDEASSTLTLGFQTGALTSANIVKKASQFTRVQRMHNDMVLWQKDTPLKQELTRDMIPTLLRFKHQKGKTPADVMASFYDAVREQAALIAEPARLSAKGSVE